MASAPSSCGHCPKGGAEGQPGSSCPRKAAGPATYSRAATRWRPRTRESAGAGGVAGRALAATCRALA